MADFIPNVMARQALRKSQKNFSILEGVIERLYDGGVELKERFGNKIIK